MGFLVVVLIVFSVLMPIFVCCIHNRVKIMEKNLADVKDVNIKLLIELKEINKKIDKKEK